MAVLAVKFYQAAEDEGYVNPKKIEKILGVTPEQAEEATRPEPSTELSGTYRVKKRLARHWHFAGYDFMKGLPLECKGTYFFPK